MPARAWDKSPPLGVFILTLGPSLFAVRWIPGPGAELAVQGRRPDRHWEGAALPVLHGH